MFTHRYQHVINPSLRTTINEYTIFGTGITFIISINIYDFISYIESYTIIRILQWKNDIIANIPQS